MTKIFLGIQTQKKEDSTKAESSNNESRTNSSNDSIADEKDQDFSSNSKTEDTVSAIAINKDGYLAKLNNESRLTNELEEAINDITSALEAYNNDEIYLDELQTSIGKIASEYNLESSQTEEIIKALISGLNEDKHKVAKLNLSDIGKAIASNDGKRNVEKALAGPDAKIPSDYLDRLVSEKLQEEGITIEDFQNYMYELEDKYDLSNEDVDRIYTDNEETIKNLISKAQEEKTTGDVFAVQEQSKFRKTYLYDMNYTSHQTYNPYTDGLVTWDIVVQTHEINLDYLNFNNVGLSLYMPDNQNLDDLKVSVEGFTSSGTFTKTGDNSLVYNLNIPKTNLPDELKIKVTGRPSLGATVSDSDPQYNSYDLGLRITPDNNYIKDVFDEFEKDWEKLVSLMPWIIPYRSGTAAAEKFKNGFNVVDTRLPSDNLRYDRVYDATSYGDKSRSVRGNFTSTTGNQILWKISDTIRLQDDQSKIGDDIFAASFENNTKTHNTPYIEVLEPKKDGSFTKLQLQNTFTNSDAFRNALNSIRPNGLIPGTVINYSYYTNSINRETNSTINVPFSTRFDDGAGFYGGSHTAAIYQVSDEEKKDQYHVAMINKFADGSDGDTRLMVVEENGRLVYCLDPGKPEPSGEKFYGKVYNKRIYPPTVDDIINYIPGVGRETRSDAQKKKIEEDLKRVFYFHENYKGNETIATRQFGMQALIYKIIDENSQINSKNPVKTDLYGEFLSNSMYNPIPNKSDIKEYVEKILNLRDESYKTNSPNYMSKETVDQMVTLDLYPTYMNGEHKPTTKVQHVIGAEVKNPIKFDKVNGSETPMHGVKFQIFDSNYNPVYYKGTNKPIEWTTNGAQKDIILDEGKYILKEVFAPTGYSPLDSVEFTVNKVTTSDKLSYKTTQQTTGEVYNKKSKYEISGVENTNFNPDTKQSLITTPTSATIKATNIPAKGKFKIYKELLDEDGKNLGPLKYVTFTLTNANNTSDVRYAVTNGKGIATFENLPTNTTWNLVENVPTGLKDEEEKWQVSINSAGQAAITALSGSKFTIANQEINGESVELKVQNEPIFKGEIIINKVDDKDNPITSDYAKFSLQQTDGNKYYLDDNGRFVESEFTFSTDETGKLNITNIPEGEYTLRETKAPSGYKINENKRTWTVNIDKDGKATIDGQAKTEVNVVNNPILTRVDLMKYGPNKNEDKVLLDGGKFILNYRQSEEDAWQKVGEAPAKEGLVSFDNLREGYYEVREEEAPTGYYEYDSGNRKVFTKATYKRRTDALKEFQVIDGKVYINNELINDKNNAMINHTFGKGKITVKKFTDDSKGDSKGLSGVKFELYKDGDADPITGETNENGILVFKDLPYGKYWVREISGPPGYIVDKSFKAAVLGYMYDAPTNGTDASYKLQLTSIDIRSSGNNPDVVRPNYSEAIWYNARFDAKEGQRLNPGDQFTLELSDNVTLDGLAQISDGDLDLASYAGKLARAEIADDRKSITYTITDVADKYYGLDWINISIPLYVDRTKVKEDQQIDVNVGIKSNRQTYSQTYNQKSIEVVYSDYMSYADAILSYTPVLNESGFENITYINYTGKYMIPKTFKFRKHSQDGDVKFTFYRLKDENTANNSINLPGSFKPDLDNTNLFDNLGTVTPKLENGYYVSDKLNNLNNNEFSKDSYVVKVTGNFTNGEYLRTFDTRSELDYINECGYGYKCGAQTSLAVYHPCACGEVKKEVKEQTIEVFNKKNSVEFLKVDGASDITNPTKLSGAEFELVKVEEGKEINYTDVKKADGNNDNGLRTSDENGKIRFELIPDGEYRLYETKAPAGYSIHFDRVLVSSFTVINGCIEVKDNKTTIPNFKYGKFKIQKNNPAGESLEGAEFTLTPLDVNFNIKEVTESTNINGEVYFYNIPDGRYKLEETKAPSSYVTDPDTKVQILIVENGNVRFEKANDNNQTSNYTYDSEQAKSIHQPMASNNANDENIVKLEFTDNEIITVINKKPTYPMTGGNGPKIVFAVLGTAVMLTALAYFGFYQMRSIPFKRRSIYR